MTKRQYVFLCGEQASGKTYQLKRAALHFASAPSVHAVLICDRVREYGDMYAAKVFVSFGHYAEYTSENPVPRICVFQFGLDAEPYGQVFREAIEQGNCAIVLDEAWEYSKSRTAWKGSPDLRRIVMAGRHLENLQGKLAKTHIVMSSQYPRDCHHSMWSQASTIAIARMAGDNASRWVSGCFGSVAADQMSKLKEHEFMIVRGQRPAWLA